VRRAPTTPTGRADRARRIVGTDVREGVARMQEQSPAATASSGTDIQEIISELRNAPEAYAMLLSAESEETVHHRPAEGEWSAVEVVCHVADLDSFNRTQRFNAILMEENPTLPAYEPDARVTEANYQALSATDALDFFKRERDLITALLETLRPHELARTGVHPRNGQRTLLQLADMRNHDRTTSIKSPPPSPPRSGSAASSDTVPHHLLPRAGHLPDALILPSGDDYADEIAIALRLASVLRCGGHRAAPRSAASDGIPAVPRVRASQRAVFASIRSRCEKQQWPARGYQCKARGGIAAS